MKFAALPFAVALAPLALAACSGAPEEAPDNEAESFAARIKGENSAALSGAAQQLNVPQAPTVAPPLPNAAAGAFAPGTATDPSAMKCGANRMGPYLGQPANDETRRAIMDATTDVNEVRFITPGGEYINPDPTHPRLNIMIDTTGIIRDARCG